MKKILVGIAIVGAASIGAKSVSATTLDLNTFSGYGECKNTIGTDGRPQCDGTNVVIIGHRMYQLNNPKIVLSGPLYTKAQVEYGAKHSGNEAPIYYLLDGGVVLQETGPYQLELKGTPKEQKTLGDINGSAYEITYIDDVPITVENIDEKNDTALNKYVSDALSQLLSDYTATEGGQVLTNLEYEDTTNTLKFTINKAGLKEKLVSFYEKAEEKGGDVSILSMFETYIEGAIRASYSVDGVTDVPVDLEEGAVGLAGRLLLAMAQNNGYDVDDPSDITYGMVANTSATGTFVYDTDGLEQTVKYTLEFYYDASGDKAALEEEKDSENDSAVSGVLDGITIENYKTSGEDQKQVLRSDTGVKYVDSTNTLTFDVTRDGLGELLSSFASVSNSEGDVMTSIISAFEERITNDTDLESITFKVNDGDDISVSDTTDVAEVAKAILSAMASANGSEQTDPTQLTYLDVIGTKATATFSYKVPYTTEKATLTYTVEFKYTPTESEIQEEKSDMTEIIDTLVLNDVAAGFNDALTEFVNENGEQILESIEYSGQKLTFNVNKEGLHSSLADFADLEATVSFDTLGELLDELGIDSSELGDQFTGPVYISELFDFFKALGITKASYEVEGSSVDVDLESDTANGIAAALLKKMSGKEDANPSDLTFLDVVNKTGKGKFTFPMVGASDKTYEIEYTLEFKYEPDMEQEELDREEASDKILNDYADTVLEQITSGDLSDIFDATKTKYDADTNTVTFAVTENGLDESIVNFLDTEAGASITEIFEKFAEGATSASYTVGQETVPVADLSNPVKIASELLKKMYGQEKDVHNLTYRDIVEGEHSEATGKFTYSVEGTDETIEIEYTLKFTYEKTALEVSNQKSEVAKQSLSELNTALSGDSTNVESSNYNEDTKTLAVELTEGAQANNLSETILSEQGKESIVPVVESLMDGAKSVEYKVSKVNYFDEKAGLAAASLEGSETIDLSGSQKTAKEVAEDIIVKAAQQVRPEASKDNLTYADLKNVKIEMQFNYAVPGEKEDATTDYIVEFLYASPEDIQSHITEAQNAKYEESNELFTEYTTWMNESLKTNASSGDPNIKAVVAAIESVNYEDSTKTATFKVKDGSQKLLPFAMYPDGLPSEAPTEPHGILQLFTLFAKGSTRAQYVVGDGEFGEENENMKEVSFEGDGEEGNLLYLAAALLLEMSGQEVKSVDQDAFLDLLASGSKNLTYNSILDGKTKAKARFFFETDAGYEYYVEFNLEFARNA